jgi:hypothetical protein
MVSEMVSLHGEAVQRNPGIVRPYTTVPGYISFRTIAGLLKQCSRQHQVLLHDCRNGYPWLTGPNWSMDQLTIKNE